jgi:release factor glutamine methyltransferase
MPTSMQDSPTPVHGPPLGRLVPRPDTELLVALGIRHQPRGARVVEFGTGSRAVAIALAVAREDLEVVATDVSPLALAVAAENVSRHGVAARVRCVAGSWWEPVRGQRFDAVLSNPPYVDRERLDLLDSAVARFEPALALFAERGEPLSSYRAIAAGCGSGLRPGGQVLVEVGVGQAAGVAAVLDRAELRVTAIERDLSGIERCVVAVRDAVA